MSSSNFALPSDLKAVALIDAKTCAATGGMSISWWHEAVRTGAAPKPVIRKSRCTRWRVKDVATFWKQLASPSHDADVVIAKAKKASIAAAAKRDQEAALKTAVGAA